MIDSLKALGLTEYESKAYIALLSHGELEGKQASHYSSVPYSAIHFVLQQLVQKNFAVMVAKRPMRFKAIRPKYAVDSLVKEKSLEFEELKGKAISELNRLERSPLDEEERVEISSGIGQRFAHSVQWTKLVKKEKLALTALDVMPVEVLKTNIAAAKRGVKCKFIATQLDESNKPLIARLKKGGFEIRLYTALKGFTFVVFDSEMVLLVLTDPKNREAGYSLKINSRGLAKALAQYFEFIWKKAKPI